MSGQETFIKIGVACVVIALGTGLVGSQLVTGGNDLASLVSNAAEEDEAGAIESADADDDDARGAEDEEAAQADNDENEDGIKDDAEDEEVAEGDDDDKDAGAKDGEVANDGDQKSGMAGLLLGKDDKSESAHEDGEPSEDEDDDGTD